MSDTLDREATPEGNRRGRATEVVPLPKSRLMPKSSTEVLALPVMPSLSPTPRKPESACRAGARFEPTKPVWMGSAEAAVANNIDGPDHPFPPPWCDAGQSGDYEITPAAHIGRGIPDYDRLDIGTLDGSSYMRA